MTKKGAFIARHNPSLFIKKIFSKALPILPSPKKRVQKVIKNDVVFTVDLDFYPPMKMMYYGMYALDVVESMKKFLRAGDTFIDVGANVGYLSAIALSLVGKRGHVHSFEPVPKVFQKLEELTLANTEYNIEVNQIALGERRENANIQIPIYPHVACNTLVEGFVDEDVIVESVEVPICRLDNYIHEKSIEGISLIKIDAEGYEYSVLKGMRKYLEANHHRPAIICEISPQAGQLLGYSLSELSEYMQRYGYHAFNIHAHTVEMDISTMNSTGDVLFLPVVV